MKDLQERLDSLPDSPGVYIFKDIKGAIIYIGKAKVLKNRVRSYFQKSDDKRYFYEYLIPKINQIDWLVTDTEKEALILENSLIKQFKPKYNVDLKDDSNFYSLKIDTNHKFPRFEFVRSHKNKNALYFGPYSSSVYLKNTMKFINQTFSLRTCSDHELENRVRPCILFQLGRCSAPCTGEINHKEYNQNLNGAIQIFKGQSQTLLDDLQVKMMSFSEKMKFEKAAEYRDKIKSIKKTIEQQKIGDTDGIDRDVYAFIQKKDQTFLQGIYIRDGMIRSYYHQAYDTLGRKGEEILLSFLSLYYSEPDKFFPKEILLPFKDAQSELLENLLEDLCDHKIYILNPQRGHKKDLLDLALKNADNTANSKLARKLEIDVALLSIQKSFNLNDLPQTMECYDISNIQGQDSVASGVAFKDGIPHKKMYRHYTIKTVNQADDFASLYEVIKRRVERGLKDNNLPKLFVIDGGKGQLNAAHEALTDCGIPNHPLVSIAKARTKKGTVDRFFLPGNEEPIYLTENSKELKILMYIRDESHRFAITHHRKVRGKKFQKNPLDEIPGVGNIKKRALIRHFGNIGAIRNATLRELLEVTEINKELAKTIMAHLSLEES